jgi:cytochrome P450
MHLEALGRPILVLNDIKMAQDLLDKRSAFYSSRYVLLGYKHVLRTLKLDRPEIPMLNEVYVEGNMIYRCSRDHRVGFTSFFSMMPYGDQWRIHRRMFQQYFSEKNLPRMREKQLEFIRKGLLPNFFQAPDEFVDHIRK